MELHRETRAGVDLTGGGTVLEYTHAAARSATVVLRLDLGSDVAPIAGGQTYKVVVSIDGIALTPDSLVGVPAGRTKARFQSRPFVLDPDGVLAVAVTGAAGDVAVATESVLFDSTPAQTSEIAGDGAIPVDHDYGGEDALRYLRATDSTPIDNGQILVYLKEDYDAGRRTPQHIVARAQTGADGRWVTPVLLDPETYVVLFYRQGVQRPTTVEITVT